MGSDDDDAGLPAQRKMNEMINGVGAAVQAAMRQPTHEEILQHELFCYLRVILMGASHVAAGVPHDKLIDAFASASGRVLGECVQGSLADVLRKRSELKDRFSKSMNAVVPSQPPTQQPWIGRIS